MQGNIIVAGKTANHLPRNKGVSQKLAYVNSKYADKRKKRERASEKMEMVTRDAEAKKWVKYTNEANDRAYEMHDLLLGDGKGLEKLFAGAELAKKVANPWYSSWGSLMLVLGAASEIDCDGKDPKLSKPVDDRDVESAFTKNGHLMSAAHMGDSALITTRLVRKIITSPDSYVTKTTIENSTTIKIKWDLDEDYTDVVKIDFGFLSEGVVTVAAEMHIVEPSENGTISVPASILDNVNTWSGDEDRVLVLTIREYVRQPMRVGIGSIDAIVTAASKFAAGELDGMTLQGIASAVPLVRKMLDVLPAAQGALVGLLGRVAPAISSSK